MPGKKSARTYEYIVTRHMHALSARRSTVSDAGLADMLRYDVATVAEELPDGRLRIVGTHPPTIRRWQSFGMTVEGGTY